jgi:hypothetical protein
MKSDPPPITAADIAKHDEAVAADFQHELDDLLRWLDARADAAKCSADGFGVDIHAERRASFVRRLVAARTETGNAVRASADRLIESAIDSDASGRPDAALYQHAMALRAAFAAWADAQKAPQPRTAEPGCARVELVVAVHTLASHFENALYAFRADDEALRKARGDIAHAMRVAAKHNYNGPGCRIAEPAPAPADEPPPLPEPFAARFDWGDEWSQWHDKDELPPPKWDDEPPSSATYVYTADQFRARDAYWIAKLQAERSKPT